MIHQLTVVIDVINWSINKIIDSLKKLFAALFVKGTNPLLQTDM